MTARPPKRAAMVICGLALIVLFAFVMLPRGPSLRDAEAGLLEAPMDNTPGKAFVTCRHTGFLGLLGEEDRCTLRYSSGPVFHCRVVPPQDSAGIRMTCDGPFRR
jgi:hypothetical protein